MSIDGITIHQEDNYIVCYIDNFSDELKELIRNELTIICHGKSIVQEDTLNFYSYPKTLKDFLSRYNNKTTKIKKGMLGEFIAHLIIDKVLPELEAISIFFNKEELSIKKGFDLNYVNSKAGSIWYGEVKAGELNGQTTPDRINKKLLGKAKDGLIEFLSGGRPNLWDSVIIDAGLSFKSPKSKKVQDLLRNDIRAIEDNPSIKKNSILISVLFHNSQNRITSDSVKQHLADITAENVFLEVIVFSIQKSTYTKIEEFLIAESQG
jgi:hypothetical protein